MISWIKGELVSSWQDNNKFYILINCHGLGYEIQILESIITDLNTNKITGKEIPVEITIKDGQGTDSGFFIVNKSKYEILDLGTGKAYAFDKNEPWTHIQDIFFLDNNVLSFILAANASITRYLCDEIK